MTWRGPTLGTECWNSGAWNKPSERQRVQAGQLQAPTFREAPNAGPGAIPAKKPPGKAGVPPGAQTPGTVGPRGPGPISGNGKVLGETTPGKKRSPKTEGRAPHGGPQNPAPKAGKGWGNLKRGGGQRPGGPPFGAGTGGTPANSGGAEGPKKPRLGRSLRGPLWGTPLALGLGGRFWLWGPGTKGRPAGGGALPRKGAPGVSGSSRAPGKGPKRKPFRGEKTPSGVKRPRGGERLVLFSFPQGGSLKRQRFALCEVNISGRGKRGACFWGQKRADKTPFGNPGAPKRPFSPGGKNPGGDSKRGPLGGPPGGPPIGASRWLGGSPLQRGGAPLGGSHKSRKGAPLFGGFPPNSPRAGERGKKTRRGKVQRRLLGAPNLRGPQGRVKGNFRRGNIIHGRGLNSTGEGGGKTTRATTKGGGPLWEKKGPL